jgi:hypothetical protein
LAGGVLFVNSLIGRSTQDVPAEILSLEPPIFQIEYGKKLRGGPAGKESKRRGIFASWPGWRGLMLSTAVIRESEYCDFLATCIDDFLGVGG